MNTHNPIMAALLAEESVGEEFKAAVDHEERDGLRQYIVACRRQVERLHEAMASIQAVVHRAGDRLCRSDGLEISELIRSALSDTQPQAHDEVTTP